MATAASTETKFILSQRTRRVVLGLIIVAAVYLLAVTPARTWWEQRQEMHAATQRYETLKSANSDLENRAAELKQDDKIQAIARERYELIPEGHKAYAVMPAPDQQVPAAKSEEPGAKDWIEKAVDAVEFWD